MIKIECNEGCGKDFILISHGTEIVSDGIERVGFSCPHCGKVYTAYYSNDEVKELHSKLIKLQKMASTIKFSPARLKAYELEVKRIKGQLKKKIDELRERVEST